jgi:hypothetical protein
MNRIMKSESYLFSSDNECLLFEFDSVSDRKTIKKVITYTPHFQNLKIFNLALGDLQDNGELSDLNVSNNSDMHKVIATVVCTMFHFFERYPDYMLHVKGSTLDRTRLYRIIIGREFQEAEKYFEIYGVIDSQVEAFIPNHAYSAFFIASKISAKQR